MLKEIVLKIIQMITAPDIAWRKISANDNHNVFIERYLHPIFGLIALSAFIGGLWFVPEGNIQIALKKSIISLVNVFGGYYISSYILNELLPRFGVQKDELKTQQFVGYASALIYALYIILPFLSDFFILWIFALYTAYIAYTGYEFYIKGNEENKMYFTGVATAVILLIPALINALLSFFLIN